MGEVIKGAPVAAALTEKLIVRVRSLKENGIIPTLAILRVGENASDISYERGAMKRCEKTGINVRQILLPADCTQDELINEIEKINLDDSIHGCLMFRPLPKHLDERAACEKLSVSKDIDCSTRSSLCSVFVGDDFGFPPCTAQSCIEIMDYYGIDPTGKRIAVIGRSMVIGKPVSVMLQSRNATVTMCHTKTENMAEICRQADVLVVAAGRAKIVDWSFVHPNQIVIDVGINVDSDGKICGDVDYDDVMPKVKAITAVPGGVGAVTTAVLCKHVVEAAERINKCV